MRDRLFIIFSFLFYLQLSTPAYSQPQLSPSPRASDLDLSSDIEDSPVLQRWREQVPNILEEITRDPSFRTRLRLGYSQFSSTDQATGITLGVEDLFVDKTRFTISGEYHTTFNREQISYGADLRYYLRPLGSYINIAPIVGYRHLETDDYSVGGVNLGARLLLVFSRNGAADISLTQSWVALGTEEEIGLTTLSVGYALTQNLRISTDIQKQNFRQSKDSRVSVVVEWMP